MQKICRMRSLTALLFEVSFYKPFQIVVHLSEVVRESVLAAIVKDILAAGVLEVKFPLVVIDGCFDHIFVDVPVEGIDLQDVRKHPVRGEWLLRDKFEYIPGGDVDDRCGDIFLREIETVDERPLMVQLCVFHQRDVIHIVQHLQLAHFASRKDVASPVSEDTSAVLSSYAVIIYVIYVVE